MIADIFIFKSMDILLLLLLLLFISKHLYVNPLGLEISPKDIILTKNSTLKVNCTVSKNLSVAIENIKFKFVIDKEPALETTNNSFHDIYFVNNSFVKVLDAHTIYLEHYVYYPKFHNSVLECYVNDSFAYKSSVLLGEFPHNITNASCLIKHWTTMHCEFNTSEINKIFTTRWNLTVMDYITRKIKMIRMVNLQSFRVENIFDVFNLSDTLELVIFGSNIIGRGNSNSFDFQLRDIVVPDPCHFSYINAVNYTFSLERLKTESFEVLMDVNCSNVVFRLKEVHKVSNDKIFINLNENSLPAAINCSAFIKIKPLGYGKWSARSNTLFFRTRDRVPLKNPNIFNSSFEIYECNSKMLCRINIYFEPLNDKEAQGNVTKYIVTVEQDGNATITNYNNNGLPFISIEGLQMSRDKMTEDYLVSIQAQTEAGYNKSLHAKPMRINSLIDAYYLHSLMPGLITNASKSFVGFPFFYIIVLNDSHADVVYRLDDQSENIWIVWCRYDKSRKRCKDNFGWLKMEDVKGVMRFVVPSSDDELNDFKFGMQVNSGIRWMDSSYCFIGETKPDIPIIKWANKSQLKFDILPPTCSQVSKTNFPGGYIVEIRITDKIIKKNYSYLDSHINLDDIGTSNYNITIYALPWSGDGMHSERWHLPHSGQDVNYSEMVTIYFVVVIIGIFVSILFCIYVYRKNGCRANKTQLKVEIPQGQHEPEKYGLYSNICTINNDFYYSDDAKKEQFEENLKLSDGFGACNKHDVDLEENISCSSDSSDLNYAVTKLVNQHPFLNEEGLQNKPARQICIPELFEIQSGKIIDSSDEITKNKSDHDDADTSVHYNNESSLADYPLIFDQSSMLNVQAQNAVGSDVKRIQQYIGDDDGYDDDYGVVVVVDDDDVDDDDDESGYCTKSKFINLSFHSIT